MGGVTRRFPKLKCAFLEGGVGWARSLLSDSIGHWEKRTAAALENYDPARLDREMMSDLSERFGGPLSALSKVEFLAAAHPEDTTAVDEWVPCKIRRKEDLRDLFVPHFYFGCEGDDPVTASAFDDRREIPSRPGSKAVYGSDIGHWDVPDMRGVINEAYEMVEKGLISEEDFRDFVFVNPVELWTGLNPDFFKGTAVEREVELLRREK